MTNDPNTQLKDLIRVERGIISPDVCDSIIDDAETRQWRKHQWGDGYSPDISYETKELDVQHIPSTKNGEIKYFIDTALSLYYKENKLPSLKGGFTRFSSEVRFNRYGRGHIMRQHYDHISSLFDGERKGIPVLSTITNFNDDYEGGELFFWDDYIVPLGKGDIVIFPSLFLFPHGVKEVTRGFRYSGVSWAW